MAEQTQSKSSVLTSNAILRIELFSLYQDALEERGRDDPIVKAIDRLSKMGSTDDGAEAVRAVLGEVYGSDEATIKRNIRQFMLARRDVMDDGGRNPALAQKRNEVLILQELTGPTRSDRTILSALLKTLTPAGER